MKRIIPAVASTNAVIAGIIKYSLYENESNFIAACSTEVFKLATRLVMQFVCDKLKYMVCL